MTDAVSWWLRSGDADPQELPRQGAREGTALVRTPSGWEMEEHRSQASVIDQNKQLVGMISRRVGILQQRAMLLVASSWRVCEVARTVRPPSTWERRRSETG